MNISAYRLAKDINVPASRILERLHGKRNITADTSLRLARYFSLSEKDYLIKYDKDVCPYLLPRIDKILNVIDQLLMPDNDTVYLF